MDLAHRLPKAALVTFVALLVFGSGIGFVSATGNDATIPEAMQLPAPQEGDEWAYSMDYIWREGDESEEGTDTVGFTWGESTVVYDDAGEPHHVQALTNPFDPEAVYIDHNSKRVVAERIDYNDTGYYSSGGRITLPRDLVVFAGPLFGSETEYNITGHLIYYGDNPGPCGFFTSMHDGPVDLSGPVEVHGACGPPDQMDTVTNFRAFEAKTINGMPTIGFEADHGNGHTRLWYNPALPYPVAMDVSFSSIVMEIAIGDDDMTIEFDLDAAGTLSHFRPGDAPWGVASGPLPVPLVPVTTANPTTLSIDETGIDHPFLLAEAFDGAMNDLQYDDLRNYMAANPDARAVKAVADQRENEAYMTYSWGWRMWSDDGGSINVFGQRSIAKPGTPEDVLQQVTGPDESYGDDASGIFAFNLDFTTVTKDRIPDKVPLVAEAFQRFEQGTGLEPTRYGFDYTCELFCWGDEIVALDVHHEMEEAEEADAITGEEGRIEALRQSYLFNSDGYLVFEHRAHEEGTSKPSTLLDGPSSGQRPENMAASEIEGSTHAGIWAPPSAEAAAGVTFLAFLVGAAYWLWPAVKSAGFMGLFSRLQPDQLLAHPVRSGIYETVQAQPGIHYQGLVRKVGKGRGVVEHHLRKLQQAGYVVSQSNGGHTCFFPKGIADHRVLAAVPVLKTEGASRVLRHIVAKKDATVGEIAAALGIAKSTASHHVRRLREAGLIHGSSPLRGTPEARKALTLAA